MTPRDFVYWLNGYLEIQKPNTIDEDQTAMIKRHLELVFVNVTNERITNPIGFNQGGWGESRFISCSYQSKNK